MAYSLESPKVLLATENLSFPPNKMRSMASLGIFDIGSESVKLKRCAIKSNCLNIQEFFWGPCGAKPPFLIDNCGSGMILFILTL